jgi:DNA-binding response OmpR family regulator
MTPLSILIVEDEAMISMMLEEYLEALGHKVAANASSVDEAMALIKSGTPDLAILDCYLGSEEIWPVADILTECGVPVILSSGGSTSTLPERYASCPMLQKPYTIGALSDILERAG